MSAWKQNPGGDNGHLKWHLRGRNFSHCNCSYGCPCQFNALPTRGNCEAVVGIVIDEGHHGGTKLDGLKFAGVAKGSEPHGRELIGSKVWLPKLGEVFDERSTKSPGS